MLRATSRATKKRPINSKIVLTTAAVAAFEATKGHTHIDALGQPVADNVHFLIHLAQEADFTIDWGIPTQPSGAAIHG